MRVQRAGGGIRGGGLGCRICSGGLIGRMVLVGLLLVRSCLLLVSPYFILNITKKWLMHGASDAEIMGLWANLESQVYAAGKENKSNGGNVPVRQMTGGDHAHGSMDGYQQEFVANIER